MLYTAPLNVGKPTPIFDSVLFYNVCKNFATSSRILNDGEYCVFWKKMFKWVDLFKRNHHFREYRYPETTKF